MADLERIYTIPLGDAYKAVRNKRAPKAVKILRSFISKHMKEEETGVILSNSLNSFIWQRSIQKPPRRIKIRAIKSKDYTRVYLADEKIEEPKKVEEPKKDEKKVPVKKLEEEPKKESKEVAKKDEKTEATEKPAKEDPKKEAKAETK
ncbi:MAG: 50S ribosomal protein L31e [Candidatus Micrarchaeota archaeon]|nr:50S ribosomal protein L31e [Candidatus Micrarchaeota archaeon]MBU1682127.1 50S ribosomal protein L31e [Candidatus Micrarchaeota archaeon]